MQAFVTPELCTRLLLTIRSGPKWHVSWISARSVATPATRSDLATRSLKDPEQLVLLPGQIDIWWLTPSEVQKGKLAEQYLQLLTPAEQQHVSEGASAEVQNERLLARTLQRTVLARYCSNHANPPSLQFERNQHGKPRLSWEESQDRQEPDIHFSLTHTPSLLGIAVSCGSPVGLDVEAADRYTKTDVLKLAKRRLAPAELASLEEVKDAAERAKHFVQLWTLKEAFVKAVGRGINAAPGLKGFSVVLKAVSGNQHSICQVTGSSPANTAYQVCFATQHREYKFDPAFVLLSPVEGHTAALCMQQQAADQDAIEQRLEIGSCKSGVCNEDGYCSTLDDTRVMSSNFADCPDDKTLLQVRMFHTVPLVGERSCRCDLFACTMFDSP